MLPLPEAASVDGRHAISFGLATAALVAGLLGVVSAATTVIIANAVPDAVANQFGQIAIMSFWAATVMGAVSLLRIRTSDGAKQGSGRATAGLMLGALGMIGFGVIVFIASSGLTL
jgi:hypothetical protein